MKTKPPLFETEIKIEKGIPVPLGSYTRHTGITSLFRKMEIGDSILIPESKKRSAYNCSRQIGALVKIRLDGKEMVRVWLIKKPVV